MADLNSIDGIHYEMMRRCYNEKSIVYKDYGAKGIAVCEEWHDRSIFKEWARNTGYRKGLRLERIDSKGDYSPSNCMWGEKYKKDRQSNASKVKKITNTRNEMHKKYGVPRNYSKTRIFRIYKGMIARCETPSSSSYKHYGGRGIKVCDEWKGKFGFFLFYQWSMENGYADNLSLDRIDVNGNYETTNCRWSDDITQKNNKRNTIKREYKGEFVPLRYIAEAEEVDVEKFRYLITVKGMEICEAVKLLKQ